MKHLLSLLLACLLLCGCARNAPEAETTEPTAVPTTAPSTELIGLYDAGSSLEAKTAGAVRAYPLNIPNAYSIRAMGDGLLILSGDKATTLTLLTGEDLYVTNRKTLDFFLNPNDPSLRIRDTELSYYDPVNRQTVVLNGTLKEVSHIAAPEDMVGAPILSADRNTLYYCTSAAIRAWDLETGIRRCVKEISYGSQTLTGLHFEDSLLQCAIEDDGQQRTLFLAADTGRLLYERDGSMTFTSYGGHYYAAIPTGMMQSLVFGEGEVSPQVLTPEEITAEPVFLEDNQAAVTISVPTDETIQLDYYEFDTGRRRSVLTLETQNYPAGIVDTIDGYVYILIYDQSYGGEAVYRWDVEHLPVNDSTDYTGPYYTAADPDYDGLARCQAYAAEIGEKYGIEVLVWEDALAVQPWDYDFEVEYLVPVLERELKLLDARLSQYPGDFLSDTASHFTALKICLVRQITGTAESGSLDIATGIQFFDGTDAYVTIAVGDYSERALYHELFHVMETHILNESIAFDQWNALNPDDFAYDYDYSGNASQAFGSYLQGDTRSFVDTYSMSFPKEDRARIMEYAMLDGNEAVFQSQPMQAKLQKLCEGIREAYGLKKSEATFLWEQYLTNTPAYAP